MRSGSLTRAVVVTILSGLLCLGPRPAAASEGGSTRKSSTTHKTAKKQSKQASSDSHKATTKRVSIRKHSRKSRSRRKRGQQAIDSERVREIQEALIRQHYMQGEPSGHWDKATEAALRKYQGDQGWQTKTVPDSRALIKLGLGPSKDGLLNPESAMTTAPATSTDPKQDATSATNANNPQL
jgi:hypothetical protein